MFLRLRLRDTFGETCFESYVLAMDDLRQPLLERQKQLTYELEKISEMLTILDEIDARSSSTLNAWRWKDIETTVRHLSTGEMDTKQEHHVSADNPTVDNSDGSDTLRRKATNDFKPAAVVRKVHWILVHANRPMTRTELLKELKEHGMEIRGYNPSKVLGTTIWRARDTFVSLPGFGYWIKDRNYAPAGHFPQGKPEADED